MILIWILPHTHTNICIMHASTKCMHVLIFIRVAKLLLHVFTESCTKAFRQPSNEMKKFLWKLCGPPVKVIDQSERNFYITHIMWIWDTYEWDCSRWKKTTTTIDDNNEKEETKRTISIFLGYEWKNKWRKQIRRYCVNRAVMAYVYILHAFIVRKCRFDDFEWSFMVAPCLYICLIEFVC